MTGVKIISERVDVCVCVCVVFIETNNVDDFERYLWPWSIFFIFKACESIAHIIHNWHAKDGWRLGDDGEVREKTHEKDVWLSLLFSKILVNIVWPKNVRRRNLQKSGKHEEISTHKSRDHDIGRFVRCAYVVFRLIVKITSHLTSHNISHIVYHIYYSIATTQNTMCIRRNMIFPRLNQLCNRGQICCTDECFHSILSPHLEVFSCVWVCCEQFIGDLLLLLLLPLLLALPLAAAPSSSSSSSLPSIGACLTEMVASHEVCAKLYTYKYSICDGKHTILHHSIEV